MNEEIRPRRAYTEDGAAALAEQLKLPRTVRYTSWLSVLWNMVTVPCINCGELGGPHHPLTARCMYSDSTYDTPFHRTLEYIYGPDIVLPWRRWYTERTFHFGGDLLVLRKPLKLMFNTWWVTHDTHRILTRRKTTEEVMRKRYGESSPLSCIDVPQFRDPGSFDHCVVRA
jgi:hypothetical protein